MFQTAELGQKVSKEDFERVAQELRTDLLGLQQRLLTADFPVIVLFAGVDGAGKSESVNLIHEWMDPRWIVTNAYGEPSDEEGERPHYWRYWRDMAPRGKIGLFLSAWYSKPLLERVYGLIEEHHFDRHLDHSLAFETMLAADGALILKFWMHLGKEAQKRRLKALEKDSLQSWRVTKQDWRNWKHYDQFIGAAERALRRTSTGQAPWAIVEGEDPRYRGLVVLTALRDALARHLDERELRRKVIAEAAAATEARRETELAGIRDHREAMEKAAAAEAPAGPQHRRPSTTAHMTGHRLKPLTVLDALDMTKSLGPSAYAPAIKKARADLAVLARQARDAGVSTLLVFEGWDAAGKGGAIRRLTAALDARYCRVIPFAAPTDEERAQHYLWRFWRHLPRAGRLTVFDRSWYGRVLVERVEGFATPAEWGRAYAEINDFEEQLVQHGMVLTKFWLNITKDEQYRRFKQRESLPYKAWKLTDEDWRNRAKWDDYAVAVNEMVERTSTTEAPWVLVEANDKNYARVKIIEAICERLRARLG